MTDIPRIAEVGTTIGIMMIGTGTMTEIGTTIETDTISIQREMGTCRQGVDMEEEEAGIGMMTDIMTDMVVTGMTDMATMTDTSLQSGMIVMTGTQTEE
nr:unnamed protein product [Callosobruchus analis]